MFEFSLVSVHINLLICSHFTLPASSVYTAEGFHMADDANGAADNENTSSKPSEHVFFVKRKDGQASELKDKCAPKCSSLGFFSIKVLCHHQCDGHAVHHFCAGDDALR